MGAINTKCKCGSIMSEKRKYCAKCFKKNHGLGYERTFAIRYKWEGKDKLEIIGFGKSAYRIAKIRLAEIDRLKMEGRHLDINLNRYKTLQQIVDWYFELNEVQMLRSYFEGRRHINTFSKRIGLKRKISDITPLLIENDRKERLKEVAPGSYDVEFGWFKSMLKKAYKYGEISSNPIRTCYKIGADDTRNVFLTDEEVSRLFSKMPRWMKPISYLAYRVPMRKNEIVKLTWEEVNLERGEIRLFNDRVKNGQGRTIPLPPDIIEELKKVPRNDNNGYVFDRRSRLRSSFHYYFKKVTKKVNLDDFRFHDFRHIAINNMRAKGNPDHLIMAVSGHKSKSSFYRYTYVSEVDVQNVKW